MLADIVERQQIETKNTVGFLRYVLARRGPQSDMTEPSQQSVNAFTSVMTASIESKKMANISKSGISQYTDQVSFTSPVRQSVMERASTMFAESYHKRPADFIKAQMR